MLSGTLFVIKYSVLHRREGWAAADRLATFHFPLEIRTRWQIFTCLSVAPESHHCDVVVLAPKLSVSSIPLAYRNMSWIYDVDPIEERRCSMLLFRLFLLRFKAWGLRLARTPRCSTLNSSLIFTRCIHEVCYSINSWKRSEIPSNFWDAGSLKFLS